MPTLYLIRHGQSVSNQLKIHQSTHDPLSEIGKLQAHALGKRLQKENIHEIYASQYIRAQQTAQIVDSHLQKNVKTLEFIGEVKGPSHFIGKHHEDPSIQRDKQLLDGHFHENWHLKDEENFFDAKKRVQTFLTWVQETIKNNTVVISHGNFIQYTVGFIQHGELYTPYKHWHLRKEIHLENTSITTIQVERRKLNIEQIFNASHLA